jgi:hypothetical protein
VTRLRKILGAAQGAAIVFRLAALSSGCATAATPAPPQSAPSLNAGPSLYETGRFAVVPPSSCGLKIEDGFIDRPPAHKFKHVRRQNASAPR